MEKIAVYGSGTIGSCQATLVIGHGLPCTVVGHSESGLVRCRKAIEQNWDDLIAQGLATEKNKTAALALLTITNDPAALEGCTFVFEAVAEGEEQKRGVYAAVEQYAAPNAVIAIVKRNVSKSLMKPTSAAGSKSSELKPITTRNSMANQGSCMRPLPSVSPLRRAARITM